MSSGLDKKWINDDKIDSEAYRIGVLNFMMFNGSQDGYHSCLCRKCLNQTGQYKLDDIAVHLLDFDIDKMYKLWQYQGEHEVCNQRQDAPDLDVTSDNIMEVDEDVLPMSDHTMYNSILKKMRD